MGELVDFPAPPPIGEPAEAIFLGCGRCSGGEFAVVAVCKPNCAPVIVALACLICEPPRRAVVENGAVIGWEGEL